jgi:4-hydroxy-L-threonine phosphate dehydrogenase PdxA
MKQQQSQGSEATSSSQKVDSPLAKYTSKGDLVCILCKAPVKSSAAWASHCTSATHKQNLEILVNKKKQQKSAEIVQSNVDSDELEPSAKRAKFSEPIYEELHQPVEPSEPSPSNGLSALENTSNAVEAANKELLQELRYVSAPYSRLIIQSWIILF